MTNETIIYLVLAFTGICSLSLWIGLVVAPAWSSYPTVWERIAATFLSVYVLASFLMLGTIVGGIALYYYDEL